MTELSHSHSTVGTPPPPATFSHPSLYLNIVCDIRLSCAAICTYTNFGDYISCCMIYMLRSNECVSVQAGTCSFLPCACAHLWGVHDGTCLIRSKWAKRPTVNEPIHEWRRREGSAGTAHPASEGHYVRGMERWMWCSDYQLASEGRRKMTPVWVKVSHRLISQTLLLGVFTLQQFLCLKKIVDWCVATLLHVLHVSSLCLHGYSLVHFCGWTNRWDEQHLQSLMMMDKDVDYRQGWLHALTHIQSVPLLSHPSARLLFPPTSLSKQHANHPPLSVTPCLLLTWWLSC